MMKLTPYILFNGNAEEALNFYADVFAGKVTTINRYANSPTPCDTDWKDKILHARLLLGDNQLMISDTNKGMIVPPASNAQLSIEIPDPVLIETIFTKMSEGAVISLPLQDMFWGAKFGMLVDKFGVSWMFNCELKS